MIFPPRLWLIILVSIIGNFPGPALAQPADTIFTVVDELPAFPGGARKMKKFTDQNLFVPRAMKDSLEVKLSRPVVVSFIVEKDGRLTEAEIKQSMHPLLDAEVLQFISKMPQWEPGKRKGEDVRTRLLFPCYFSPVVRPILIYSDPDARRFHRQTKTYDFGCMYKRFVFSGKISDYLKEGYGLSVKISVKHINTFRLAFEWNYYTCTVLKPFERGEGTWQLGRYSGIYDFALGFTLSKRIFHTKDYAIEIAPLLSTGLAVHQPARAHDGDPSEGFRSIGARIGTGVDVYWHPFKHGLLNLTAFRAQASYDQILMESPLQGGLFSTGLGLVYILPIKKVAEKK